MAAVEISEADRERALELAATAESMLCSGEGLVSVPEEYRAALAEAEALRAEARRLLRLPPAASSVAGG